MLESSPTRIYLDFEDVPTHPGSDWTRFVCVSDTHSHRFLVPSGDVLLHAGDLSNYGHHEQLSKTLDWLKSLEHPVKIIIAGNHDLCLDEKWSDGDYTVPPNEINAARSLIRSESVRRAGIHYVEHSTFQFTTAAGRQWKLYGSPGSPIYARGAFQYSTDEEADAIYKQIPADTEILLTHTPPHKTLDLTRRGKHAGCKRLARMLCSLDACRLHVFGHIHEARGAEFVGQEMVPSGHRVAVNAAMCIRGHSAIIIDLKN